MGDSSSVARPARLAAVSVAAMLLLLPLGSGAQSGKSWMNGIVFGESETQGLGGAVVELVGDSDAPQVHGKAFRTVAGADGKYAFERIPYGDYRYRVSAPGFVTYEISLYVASDALTALHVHLKPRRKPDGP